MRPFRRWRFEVRRRPRSRAQRAASGWLIAGLCMSHGLVGCRDESALPPSATLPLEETDGLRGMARAWPDSARDGFALALRAVAAAETDSARAAELASASALARAYAAAWEDSFLIRRLARFEAASPSDRRGMAAADSLWRAGREAYGREGVPAAMALWRESLRRASTARDSATRAVALGAIGAGFYVSNEPDSALAYLEEARGLADLAGDHRTAGNAVANLANVRKDRGELAAAAEHYREATAIRTRIGDSRGMASDQNNLGLIAWELGDLGGARAAFERALALNRAQGAERYAALNLTNLGDLASLEGDYAAAEAAYGEALAINESAGDAAEMAFVLHDLGLLATRRGDYGRAIELLSRALELHERSDATLEAVAVRSDLAAARAAMGDLQGAVADYTEARLAAAAAAEPPSVQAGLALRGADLALALGRYAEADAEFVRAEGLYTEDGSDAGVAEARQGRGALGLLREDHKGALELLGQAARGQERAGDRRAAALTRLLVGDAQRDMGDTAAARLTFEAAWLELADLGDRAGEVAAIAALADLSERAGAPLAAEALYRAGLDRLGDRPIPDLRWRLHAGLATALRGRGALAPAADELRAAVASIEAVATGIRVEDRRAGFLADKWQVYSTLADVERALGRVDAAFAVSERMRGRQMLALLGRGRVAWPREAAGREQDLRRRIAELTEEIEMASTHPQPLREPPLVSASVDVAREALDMTQRAYADLLLEIRDREPDYARLVSAEPVGWRRVADRLRPDEVLLQYLVSESSSTAFVVTRDTVVAIDLGVSRRDLAALVDFARRAMDRPDGVSDLRDAVEAPPDGAIDAPVAAHLWRAPLQRLHRLLIEPVERGGHLRGKRTLVIVPHAELHGLPFGALIEVGPEPRFLIEDYDLVYAPSATVWVQLRVRPAPKRRSPRVLALAPHTTRLPESRTEVAGIRDLYGRRATVLVDDAASERALRAAVSRHDILHLATFGVLNKHNPLFSYVELAPGRATDGRLEVHEVFDLELGGQLVVLSACQTGLSSGALADVPPGDDWVGLTQSFLQAGAGRVLATLWPVQDGSTALLMKRFYRALAAGRSEAAALAEAQRTMLREPEFAEPFHWAGFVLTGTGSD